MKNIKRFAFYFLLLFTITTLLFTVTGYQSRWDFSYRIVSWEIYIQKLPGILAGISVMAILAIILNHLGEKAQKERDSTYLKQMSEREQLKSEYDLQKCRVCGHQLEQFPWGNDAITPSFDQCDCCGGQFGKDDVSNEIINEYRQQWVNNGSKWFNKKVEPSSPRSTR